MTHNVGDAGHMAAHNTLASWIKVEAARFGITPTVGGPYMPGDPAHIEQHNKMIDDLTAMATVAGKTYTIPLPPKRTLGNDGHTDDHNALEAAVVEAGTWPGYNSIIGGTAVEITDGGKRYRVHTIEATGNITIEAAPKPFWILLAGGGYGGGHGDYGSFGGGGGGFTEVTDATLPTGQVAVTVGAPDGGSTSIASYSAEGAKGGNGVPGAGGGAGAGNGGQGEEGPRSSITGTDRGYCGGGSSVNWNYCCDPCCFGGTANASGGGSGRDCAPAAWYYGGGGGRPQHTCGTPGTGYQGVVIIRYEIV